MNKIQRYYQETGDNCTMGSFINVALKIIITNLRLRRIRCRKSGHLAALA
jgi:hypothetical protein